MIGKLTYNNFGIHKDKVVQFKPGINAIIGKNRKGKTTLFEGISFLLWGRTKNSTLDKIKSFGTKQASVESAHIKRIRKSNISVLEKIEKDKLDKLLNISYEEFLRIFYISTKEAQKLFEPSYFRNFLIGLFDLNKYGEVYSRLKTEHDTLLELINRPIIKVNKPLYKARNARVLKYEQQLETKYAPLKKQYKEIQEKIRDLEYKSGTVATKLSQVQRKETFLKNDKCPTCKQDIIEKYKLTEKERLVLIRRKLEDFNEQIIKYLKNALLIQDKIEAKLGEYSAR